MALIYLIVLRSPPCRADRGSAAIHEVRFSTVLLAINLYTCPGGRKRRLQIYLPYASICQTTYTSSSSRCHEPI